jgi:hypothetical protein
VTKNLLPALINKKAITISLLKDLLLGKVTSIILTSPFIYSLLSFVVKANKILYYIYYLSFSANLSINRRIDKDAAFLKYITFNKVF